MPNQEPDEAVRIRVELERLVLVGFDYHDHRRIGAAFEKEFERMIRDNGLPGGRVRGPDSESIGAPTFFLPVDMNPRTIGTRIARSVYASLGR
jgi:hypothetical protein